MKRYLAFALVLFLLASPTPVFAWGVQTQPKDKQVIAEAFWSSTGTTSNKRPSGTHYQLAMVCTNGFFEVDLFKLNPRGDLAVLGNVTSVSVQSQEKGRRNYKVVSLDGDALRLTESKAFYQWILDQKRIGVYFKMENGEDYRAYFNVSGAAGLAKKFASVGCKV
ncbi:unannotated protein [freshwater metagenome]|uniref:Unannotated protein n=1 Tax=freshwater metagenome TaxID=449393 RepID=A0A6J6FHH0_9ZZZZ|nr:hypothetical protein [Actinomycetota bacterium]